MDLTNEHVKKWYNLIHVPLAKIENHHFSIKSSSSPLKVQVKLYTVNKAIKLKVSKENGSNNYPHLLFFLSVTMKELPKICFITEFGILLMDDGSDGSDGIWQHFPRHFFPFLVQCCCQLFLLSLYHTAVLNKVFLPLTRTALPFWTHHIFCWVFLNWSTFSAKAQSVFALLERDSFWLGQTKHVMGWYRQMCTKPQLVCLNPWHGQSRLNESVCLY